MTDVPATRLDPMPFAEDLTLMKVWNALPQARVVGGAVRDVLAHRAVSDIDLASPLAPEAATAALRAANIRVVPTGLAHGTITAVVDGRGFEVTTLRHDVETDGRHAVVAFTGDWRTDALRRDFTINAMSLARDGCLFDYVTGVADLREGRVRFVGDPAERIAEDYLRILRFFRFQARYGLVPPDADTEAALRAGIPGFARLSIERVATELLLILRAPDPVGSVTMMQDLGVLQAVAPELTDLAHLAALQASGAPADPILRLAALLTGDPVMFAERLKLSNEDKDRLARLATVPSPRASDDDATLRRLLADHAREDLIDRSRLDGGESALRQRLASISQPVFPLEGKDVLALGIAPGPKVGVLLRSMREWWLAAGADTDRATCLTELRRRACIPE
jgi:poly(A) polymerase/tRNA nucleotidyltransferase (CCA-adding enzyme)